MALDKAYFDKYKRTKPEEGDVTYFDKYKRQEGPVEVKTPDKGWESIFGDVMRSGREAPGELIEGAKQLPQQATDMLMQSLLNPQRAATNAAIGLNQFGRGTLNTIPNIAEYFQSKGIGGGVAKWLAGKKIPTGLSEFEQKALGAAPETAFGFGKRGDEALQGTFNFLPSMAVPGGPLAKLLSGGLWGVGQEQNPITSALMNVLPDVAKGTPKAAKAITESLSKIPEYAEGIKEKGLNLIGKENLEEFGQNIAEKQGKKMPGSEWMEKNINPEPYTTLPIEKIEQNIEDAQGLEIPIGKIFGDPVLSKEFTNELANVENSPAKKMMMNTARTLTDEGDLILNKLQKEATPAQKAHVGETVVNEVRTLGEEINQTKKAKYDTVDKLAKDQGVTTNRANYRKFARERLEDIESDKDLAGTVDPEVKRILKEAATESENENFSIKKSNILKGDFGEYARDARAKNNTKLAGVYDSLNKALKDDINEAIEQSGDPELKKSYQDAEKYYQDEFVPFKDADIMKYTEGKGDPDMLLQSFVKISRLSDRSRLVKKITDKLNPDTRDLFAHEYLSNAKTRTGKINPLIARTLWEALGEGQQNAMFGNYTPLIDRYIRRVTLGEDALNMQYNPQTGVQAMPILTKMKAGLASGGGMAASIGMHNPILSGAIGLAMPQIAKTVAKQHHNFLVKRHTSPSYRRKVANKKIREIRARGSELPKELRYLNESLEKARLENMNEYEDLRKSKGLE